MATSWTRRFVFSGILFTGAAGCGSTVAGGGSGETQGGPVPTTTATTPPPASTPSSYPGKGFIVHEWGTDTVVVGSDGSLQRGLHHEEEDLPAFVYDRIKAGSLTGSGSVEVKMETPVTYFYSDVPRTVHVAVDFPQGVFTQWYPAVNGFYPGIAGPNSMPGVTTFRDPVFELDFPFGQKTCSDKYAAIANGMLDWEKVDILARDAAPPALPDAPLDAYTWSHARNVAANPLRVVGVPGAMDAPQAERFLFYRGLGNFDLPLQVTASPGGKVEVATSSKLAFSGRMFVINVGGGKGAFTVKEQEISGGAAWSADVPSLDGALGAAEYADALATQVTEALDATGLYHDEAQAMVATWKRQWFGTPGVRVLYLVPQTWTDSSIPLTITPKPDAMLRVMMIRVEVITPELEALDSFEAGMLAGGAAPEAEKHFLALGRFAEPRLRRALSLLGDPALGQSFLAAIATADTRLSTGE